MKKIIPIIVIILALPALAFCAQFTVIKSTGGTVIGVTNDYTLNNSSLVGWWTFDGKNVVDGAAMDRTPNALTGTLKNIATSTFYVAGKIGQAFNFISASSQQVTVAPNSALDVTAVTVSAWVKGTSFPNAYNGILQRGNAAHFYEYFVKSNGKIGYFILPNSGVFCDGLGVTTLSTGIWYHVVMTYNSVQGLIGYVNGVQDCSVAPNGIIGSVVGTTLAIGNDFFTAGRFFNGSIDDVRVYNRALSATEVQQLYNIGTVTFKP